MIITETGVLSLSQTLRARERARRLLIHVQEFISIAIFGQVIHRGEYTIVIAVVNTYRNDNLPFCKMKPPALSNSWSDTFSFVRESQVAQALYESLYGK